MLVIQFLQGAQGRDCLKSKCLRLCGVRSSPKLMSELVLNTSCSSQAEGLGGLGSAESLLRR